MNDSMNRCTHDYINGWCTELDGKSAGLWSCVQCKRKFVPLDLEMERDAMKYRELMAEKQHDGN